ncbi:hypothetical protein ABK046_52675, partial [Streptomyces caeruleatus]
IDLTAATVRELARQCHIAERDDDDVLLMNVQSEVESREVWHTMPTSGERYRGSVVWNAFMEHYRDLWTTEFAPKKRK